MTLDQSCRQAVTWLEVVRRQATAWLGESWSQAVTWLGGVRRQATAWPSLVPRHMWVFSRPWFTVGAGLTGQFEDATHTNSFNPT